MRNPNLTSTVKAKRNLDTPKSPTVNTKKRISQKSPSPPVIVNKKSYRSPVQQKRTITVIDKTNKKKLYEEVMHNVQTGKFEFEAEIWPNDAKIKYSDDEQMRVLDINKQLTEKIMPINSDDDENLKEKNTPKISQWKSSYEEKQDIVVVPQICDNRAELMPDIENSKLKFNSMRGVSVVGEEEPEQRPINFERQSSQFTRLNEGGENNEMRFFDKRRDVVDSEVFEQESEAKNIRESIIVSKGQEGVTSTLSRLDPQQARAPKPESNHNNYNKGCKSEIPNQNVSQKFQGNQSIKTSPPTRANNGNLNNKSPKIANSSKMTKKEDSISKNANKSNNDKTNPYNASQTDSILVDNRDFFKNKSVANNAQSQIAPNNRPSDNNNEVNRSKHAMSHKAPLLKHKVHEGYHHSRTMSTPESQFTEKQKSLKDKMVADYEKAITESILASKKGSIQSNANEKLDRKGTYISGLDEIKEDLEMERSLSHKVPMLKQFENELMTQEQKSLKESMIADYEKMITESILGQIDSKKNKSEIWVSDEDNERYVKKPAYTVGGKIVEKPESLKNFDKNQSHQVPILNLPNNDDIGNVIVDKPNTESITIGQYPADSIYVAEPK